MKCRNIFLGTAFTNYPFLWNTAGFICFKKQQPAIRTFTRIAGCSVCICLRSDFQGKSCSELQGFALLKEFISERLEIEGIIRSIQQVLAP